MLLCFCQRSSRCFVSVRGQLALTDGPADKCHVGNVTKQQCSHGHSAGTAQSWHEHDGHGVFLLLLLEWMNEWMNVLSLFRFSIMTIIIISNLFKPWNHLLQKQRGLYLHPVSSATRTLSSSWPRWRTWPRVYVGGGNKISFTSSFNG